MKAYLSAIRAITALYAQSIVKLVALGLSALFLLLFVLIGYLATSFSLWWWVFMAPISLIFLVVGALLIAAWWASRRLLPRQLSRHERKQVLVFTEKINRLAEQSRTPYPIILFYVIKDALLHRENRFIKGVVDDSSSLRGDFEAIRRLF